MDTLNTVDRTERIDMLLSRYQTGEISEEEKRELARLYVAAQYTAGKAIPHACPACRHRLMMGMNGPIAVCYLADGGCGQTY